jgi:Ala-tRNA(Pro) deacylase
MKKGGTAMPIRKLKNFLDDRGIKYVTVIHSAAYTAQEIAASAHIRGKELAKTVMIIADDKMAMAVVPATCRVDFDLLKKSIGARKVELASEEEFKDVFPDCEVGAMPPFGNLYGIDVYVDKRLAEDRVIAFNAGSHTELIKLPYADYLNLVKPKQVDIC